MSVRAKPPPIKSSRCPCECATSYAKQSPKFGAAGCRLFRHLSYACATRRAEATVTATISNPNPSIKRSISSLTLRRAATTKASAIVTADIIRLSSPCSAAIQASASGSLSRIAISADVSTEITPVSHRLHRGNPDSERHLERTRRGRRPRLASPPAAFGGILRPASAGQAPAARPDDRGGSGRCRPRLGAPDEIGQLRFGIRHRDLHRTLNPGPLLGPVSDHPMVHDKQARWWNSARGWRDRLFRRGRIDTKAFC